MTRSRVLVGVVLIVIGGLFLGELVADVDAWSIISDWWPAVVVAAGLLQLSTPPRNPVGGLLVTGLGVALLLWSTGVVDTLAFVWPLALIAFGVWLLAKRPGSTGFATGEGEIAVVFADRKVRVPAGAFHGETVTCVFGDVDLDLRDATISDDVTMKITCVFGDVDLIVPPTWNVVVSGPEIFAGVKVSTPRSVPEDAPTLRLSIVAVMADIKVEAA